MAEHVVAMTKKHGAQAAELHHSTIRTGFLTSLGPMFLRQLYAGISSCPSGFGFVWRRADDGSIRGFVACAEDTARLYRQVLLRRGLLMAVPLVRFAVRPSVIRRACQTLRYPADVGPHLPRAEILSIAVAEDARGTGIGRALLEGALGEFARRGIRRVRVAVWDRNESAIRLYRACGFALAATRLHHGRNMNIYTVCPAGRDRPESQGK